MSKLKIYSADGCQPCVDLKNYLKEKKVDFELIDITNKENFKKVRSIIKKTNFRAIPIIEKGKKTIVGFDKAAIDKLIEIGR